MIANRRTRSRYERSFTPPAAGSPTVARTSPAGAPIRAGLSWIDPPTAIAISPSARVTRGVLHGTQAALGTLGRSGFDRPQHQASTMTIDGGFPMKRLASIIPLFVLALVGC